jgi:hypothetical protein
VRRASPKLASLSRDLLVSVLPAVLALVAGPFVLQLTFERERALARPILSLEYAFLMRDREPMPEGLRNRLLKATETRAYLEFVTSSLAQGSSVDLRTFAEIPGSRLSPAMHRKLVDGLATYRQHLEQSLVTIGAGLQQLSGADAGELRRLAFLNLDTTLTASDQELRQRLTEKFEQRGEAIRSALRDVEDLQNATSTEASNVRMRISILNRGATDGLVRQHGEVQYRGAVYPLKRTAPPSADLTLVAVPVFQTNEATDSISLQSVGKIEKDSMADLWFEFAPKREAGEHVSALCRPSEALQVTLYDHDKQAIVGRLECNQEGG